MIKKIFAITVLMIIMMQLECQSAVCNNEVVKNYLVQEKQHRMVIYNALNLTEEQISKNETIIKEHSQYLEEKFQDLVNENYKLALLKEGNCSDSEIKNQENIIKNIKSDIQKELNKEDKQFKKELTRTQRSKYSMIKRLEKLDEKRDLHEKDYYKSNPELKKFGNCDF